MLHVSTAQGSREIDHDCENNAGLSAQQLMEQASRSAADIILDVLGERQRVAIVCGNGNNGGDGYAIARMLQFEHDVVIVADPDPQKMSDATRANFELVQDTLVFAPISMGLDVTESCDAVIDAVYGTGFRGTLLGTHVDWLGTIASELCIAIDIPSGLNADTGIADDCAFSADITITMETIKLGMLTGDGPDVCGEIILASIGAPPEITEQHAMAHIIEPDDVREFLPERKPHTSKFDYGRVLVIAGSQRMRGAAALVSSAAMRSGSGLVELATTHPHPLVLREVISTVLPSTTNGAIAASARPLIEQRAASANVIAIGPGIGDDTETITMLAEFINALDLRIGVVIDADGLRMLPLLNRDMSSVILTPHHGEYRHLTKGASDLDTMTVLERIENVKNTALQFGTTIYAKSYPSIVTDGTEVFLVESDNPGMATAGSGDVLTGIIASLMGQGLSPMHAGALGGYIHREAGDAAVGIRGEEAMIAGDIIEHLGEVLHE